MESKAFDRRRAASPDKALAFSEIAGEAGASFGRVEPGGLVAQIGEGRLAAILQHRDMRPDRRIGGQVEGCNRAQRGTIDRWVARAFDDRHVGRTAVPSHAEANRGDAALMAAFERGGKDHVLGHGLVQPGLEVMRRGEPGSPPAPDGPGQP